MKKAVTVSFALALILVLAMILRTQPVATPSQPVEIQTPPPANVRTPLANQQPEKIPEPPERPHEAPPAIAPASRLRPIDPKTLLKVIEEKAKESDSRYRPAPTGSVSGTLAGLRDGESGGAFAIKGEYSFANISEDDLYDFGEFAESEAHVAEDGTFSMKELEDGHYTIIAFSIRNVGTPDAEFYYTFGGVDVVRGGQAKISLTL